MRDLICETRHGIDRHMVALCGTGPVAAGVQYHMATGGGRVRAKLALEAGEILDLADPVALACACGPELLHNASLVHDDLQDRDETRRGQPAVWRRFGPAAAISIGDLMISAAYAALASHPDPARAILLAHDALSRTARGQANDLMRTEVSVAAYRAMAADKTGALIALPVRLALAARQLTGTRWPWPAVTHWLSPIRRLMTSRIARRTAVGPHQSLCALLSPADHGVSLAQAAAREALDVARRHAAEMPDGSGRPFCNLADRMDSRLTEYANAA